MGRRGGDKAGSGRRWITEEEAAGGVGGGDLNPRPPRYRRPVFLSE